MEPQNNIIYFQLYSTMDPECSGGYDEVRAGQYIAMLEKNNYDFASTNKEALSILSGRIKEHPEKMPKLLLKKGVDAYANNSIIFWWSYVAGADASFRQKIYEFRSNLEFIDTVYYCLIIFLMIIAVFLVKEKEIYFILLTILGSGMVSLLVESQGRYKYSIEPLWCIPAAFGLCKLYDCIRKRQRQT